MKSRNMNIGITIYGRSPVYQNTEELKVHTKTIIQASKELEHHTHKKAVLETSDEIDRIPLLHFYQSLNRNCYDSEKCIYME